MFKIACLAVLGSNGLLTTQGYLEKDSFYIDISTLIFNMTEKKIFFHHFIINTHSFHGFFSLHY